MNAVRDGNHIRVYDAFKIKESLKEITGRFYDADDKAWVVPYSPENASLLGLLGVELPDDLLPKQEETHGGGQDDVPIIPMPIKAKPYQHQVRAYNFALHCFGIGGKA